MIYLRCLLFAVAFTGIWLGAIFFQSLLAVELAAAATNFLLLLSIALAIWHPHPTQQKFWTGFCLMGLGSVLLATYFSAYEMTSVQLAKLVAGDVTNASVTWGYPTTSTSYLPSTQPTYAYSALVPQSIGMMPVGPPWQLYQCVMKAVPPILSLIAACAGGWLTLWISRPRKAETSS